MIYFLFFSKKGFDPMQWEDINIRIDGLTNRLGDLEGFL